MSSDAPPPKSADLPGITKWVVIGVIAIVALFTLKHPLERLVDRTEEVKAGSFSLKTAHTVIGEVKVSAEQVSHKEAAGNEAPAGYNKYVGSGFTISWPDSWMQDDAGIAIVTSQYQQRGGTAQVLFYCRQNAVNDIGGASNVFVAAAPYDNSIDFTRQFELYKTAEAQALGARILSEDSDPATKGATLTLSFQTMVASGETITVYQIQRFVCKGDRIFHVVANTMMDDSRTQEELRSIINSFRIVQAAEGV